MVFRCCGSGWLHVFYTSPSLVGDDLGDDPWKWRSCVLGRDGCIYGIPYDGQQLLKFNPATETSQLVGGVPEGGKGKWLGAALGFDGYIYGIPHNARCVLKYDPVYNRTKFLNIDGNCGSIVDLLLLNGTDLSLPMMAVYTEFPTMLLGF